MSKVKKVLNSVKDWIVGNGIEGAAGLGVGVGLWIFGLKIWAGVAFGIFIHKNWDLAKSKLKSKL
jgi:transketolase C-terminal domain/subunit|tara:strand:+ start:356 stop:550 length:195 start_codon:yes stop_codon:yes gene_type:complete